MILKTYSELIQYKTFLDRYNYCRLIGEIGITSFGFERSLNQRFYRSAEWQHVRNQVIVRDEACDLAIPERSIYGFIRVHHLNPISVEDFRKENFTIILNPEYLVCTSLNTHTAIHFGIEQSLYVPLVERRKGDTNLWTVS